MNEASCRRCEPISDPCSVARSDVPGPSAAAGQTVAAARARRAPRRCEALPCRAAHAYRDPTRWPERQIPASGRVRRAPVRGLCGWPVRPLRLLCKGGRSDADSTMKDGQLRRSVGGTAGFQVQQEPGLVLRDRPAASPPDGQRGPDGPPREERNVARPHSYQDHPRTYGSRRRGQPGGPGR